MDGKRRISYPANLRSFLVIATGVVLGLLLLRVAVPRKPAPPGSQRGQPQASLPNTGEQPDGGATRRTATATPGFQGILQASIAPGSNCTYTGDYWRDRPEAWMTDNIVIGQFSFTKDQALEILARDTEDAAIQLQKQFLAAVLNTLKGADPTAIEEALTEASRWIDAHPPGIEMPTVERHRGSELTQVIAAFNNGMSGPGLCPDQPATPTPTPTRTPTATATATRVLPSAVPSATRTLLGPGFEIPTGQPGSPTPAPPTPTPAPPTAVPTSPPAPATPTSAPPPPATATSPPPPTARPTDPPPTAAPTDIPGNGKEPKPTKEPRPTKEPKPTDPPPPAASQATQVAPPAPTGDPEPTQTPPVEGSGGKGKGGGKGKKP